MQNNRGGNYYAERNLVGSDRYPRRMSTSGFEYPKDLSNVQYPFTFQSIPECKYQNILPQNMSHMVNGDGETAFEMANQNFFSENNVNLSKRAAFDTLTVKNDGNVIPRFGSTPLISQTTVEQLPNPPNFTTVSSGYNQPTTSLTMSNDAFNRQNITASQIFQNGTSLPYFPSPFVIYDPRTNSFQNVLIYSSTMPSITSEMELNGDDERFELERNNYDESLLDQFSQERCDQNCPKGWAQENLENDPTYFLPPELPSDPVGSICIESRSMPSLHGDDSSGTDLETSEDDQLNTVHGEEMLQELQKLSSVFTNIVNMPMSRHSDVIGSTTFLGHSNMSRFKKTRIQERRTYWHLNRILIKDNMVKIIPGNIFNIKPMTVERMEEFEVDILCGQFLKEHKTQPVMLESPDCVHTICRCRSTPSFMKHSSRSNQKYRSSFTSHSPNDLGNTLNQQLHPTISSRLSQRKSLTIPVRIPIVWNPILSMPSPAVQHRNRMFLDPSNICNSRNSRRKRRWSVSGTKSENNYNIHSHRPPSVRTTAGDSNRQIKFDFSGDFIVSECGSDNQFQINSSFESKLDKQLMSLKRTILSYMESNQREIRDERQSLKAAHASLERQVKYYRERVQQLEQSVRQNLPQEQWELYGMVDIADWQR